MPDLRRLYEEVDELIGSVQEGTACTMLDCCRNLRKSCLHNPCPQRWGPIPFFGQADRRSLPPGCLCSSQKWGTSSHILARRHTQTTHTPVIWICDLCHQQINKKQTPIRCNHTHWVHLNYTHIKQRQYKPDWRCTIHTPTQNVTTTPITDNTTSHHKQTTTHPLTNNNQPKDKNIVILQINLNGIRNKIEELKKLSTQHPTGHHHNTGNKTHTESQNT